MITLLSIAGLLLALHVVSSIYNADDYRPLDLGQDIPSIDHEDRTDGGWQVAPMQGLDW